MVDLEIEQWKAKVQSDLEHWKAQIQSNLTEYEAETAQAREMFKSVILAGQNALKSVILINGGAAVALLAFIGSIWNNDLDRNIAAKLLVSMSLFVGGVLLSGIAASLTYLIQLLYQNKKSKPAKCLNITSSILVTISYILFVVACVFVFVAFWKQLS